MKKFAVKILIYTILLSFSYWVLITLISIYPILNFHQNLRFKKAGYGHMFTRLNEIDSLEEIDIMVVGSSHAYRGFDPRIFKDYNIKIFNLGSSNQSPIATEFLLKNYIPKIKPKMVIWEVFPIVFENDGYEAFVDIVSNFENPIFTFPLATSINSVASYNTFMISVGRKLLSVDDTVVENRIKGSDTYINGGYVEKIHIPNNKAVENKREIQFRDKQLLALTESLNYLKSQNVKVVLIQSPVSEPFYKSIKNNKSIDSIFNQLVDDNLIKHYINYNNLNLDLNDQKDFYDLHHLNQSGVEKFNRDFIFKYLQKEKY